ncbi:MAG: hemolysin family protein [Chlamydiales bacterium]|nr:hemolysin family protein [Chlamydiales bacterium]
MSEVIGFILLACVVAFFVIKRKSFFKKTHSRESLEDLLQEISEGNLLSGHDKKLFQSVLSFRDRIVREVMVPRVDLFCLPETTTVREAARSMQKEGYSRVPVYKNTQDHIVGVVLYKDIVSRYMDAESKTEGKEFLDKPIEDFVKNVLYTPETKKISVLLQEFRKKQMHLAVVVDEYGGTAGVVTIEDILEEIVGEIADEYDEAEVLVFPTGRGAWVVDGRINLLDLSEEIGIKVPQEGEYDTMAGYVFYRLGTIPKKGVVLHHDDFDIEILSSGDRFVQKVKITPIVKSS